MTVALTGYPLSLDYQLRLEAELGETPRYFHLPELRRRRPASVLRALSTFGPTCVVPLEDEESYPLLPILESLAAVSPARRIEVVHPDLRREPVSRTHALRSLASLLRASAAGRIILRRSRRELDELLTEPRRRQVPGDSDTVVYANGNLWFGVRAGGSVGHVAGVLNGFRRAGLAVEYHAASRPLTARSDVAFHAVAPPRSFALPAETTYYVFNALMADALSARLLTPAQFVYQRMSVGNYAGVVASRRRGVPLVLEYNGSEVWAAEHWGSSLRYAREARAAEDACLRHASLVVTISEVLREELVSRGVEPARIVCHPNGVDTSVFDPDRFDAADRAALRRSLQIPDRAAVAGFVGTFGAWHGTETLARTIVRLVDQDAEALRRQSVRFLLVGDGVRMQAVRRLLDRDPYREFVVLTGLVPQEEAARYLAISDVLVSPHVPNPDGTRFFGSPTKLFEYMAMAKAIVASDLGQISDVLRESLRVGDLAGDRPADDERRVAVLVKPGDEGELLRALRFLLDQPDWRDVLGANARREVVSHYTWEHHVAAILDGLERIEP